jgi:twitching motility protein PilT
MEKKLKQYLEYLIKNEGSDLHLKSDANVYMRVNGELFALKNEKLTNSDVDTIAKEILTAPQYEQLVKNKELDCSYTLNDTQRFRVNFFYQVSGLSAVMRVIPDTIHTIEELHLPSVLNDLADLQSGLVLVTGVTGSGKSTTLASILDKINTKYRKHIVSIEDPIEYIHPDKKSLVSQRGIGTNTHSFSNALRAALREDIDILFIGELRDLETMEIALLAANTGHLVFSTLHTLDAKESLSRIIGMFPPEEQERIRMTLSFTLEGIVSQRLVKGKSGGRIPAVEIMKKTSRISELIADKRDHEILDAIIKGKEIYGSQSFDQSLLELYNFGKITKEEALKNATSPSDMNLMLDGIMQTSGQDSMHNNGNNVNKNFFDLKKS